MEKIQDTPLEVFDALGDGDVLFIDTSHTVKTGGDVPWIFEEVLPRLAPGVVVHIHDIFLPGDYPSPGCWRAGAGTRSTSCTPSWPSTRASRCSVGAQYLLQTTATCSDEAFPGLREHAARGGGGPVAAPHR